MRDLDNTVIVVEHDEEVIRSADYIVDLGPLGGENGGRVVYSGPVSKLIQSPGESITGQYLSGTKNRFSKIPAQGQRKDINTNWRMPQQP